MHDGNSCVWPSNVLSVGKEGGWNDGLVNFTSANYIVTQGGFWKVCLSVTGETVCLFYRLLTGQMIVISSVCHVKEHVILSSFFYIVTALPFASQWFFCILWNILQRVYVLPLSGWKSVSRCLAYVFILILVTFVNMSSNTYKFLASAVSPFNAYTLLSFAFRNWGSAHMT